MFSYIYIHNTTPEKYLKRHHFTDMPLIYFTEWQWIASSDPLCLYHGERQPWASYFLPENNYLQDGIQQILFQNTDAWINQLKEKINTDDQGCMLCLRHQKLSLKCFYANMFHLILSSLCSKIIPQFIMITCNFAVRGVHSQNNYVS